MPERQVITALTGTAAPLLTVNAANRKELDFASFFLPREWKKACPFVIDYAHLDPCGGNQNWGSEFRFELPKQANLVTDLILEVNLEPHAITNPAGVISYSDWLGYALIDYFQIRFGSNMVYSREPMDLYIRTRKTLGLERLESLRQQVRGDQTTAQRSALFVNGSKEEPLLVPLYLPFCDDPMMALPILCLSQKTSFELRTKALENIIQNLPGYQFASTGFPEFKLRLQVIHTTGSEGEFLLDLSRHPSGISYMIHQNVRQEHDIILSSEAKARKTIALSGITKPIQALTFGLIPNRFVNKTGYNDYFFFNPNPPPPVPPGMSAYAPLVAFEITANGLQICRRQRRTYNIYHIYDMYDKGFAGEDLYTENYSWWPHAINSAMGYLDFTNLNNPQLILDLGVDGTGVDPLNPAVPQELRLVVNATDYNFWFFKGGNWTRTFN